MPTIQPSMVAMLFEEGLSPNDYSCGSTPWQAFLEFLAKREHLEYNWASLTPWVDVCRLFVLFGANVKFGCMLSGEWKSTWEVLESAFQHLPCESLQELKTMVLNRGGGKDSTRIRRPRNQHHKNRFQHRAYRFQRDRDHDPCAQHPKDHPQSLPCEDQMMTFHHSRKIKNPRK